MSQVITRTIDITIIQSENIYVTSCEYKDVSTEVLVVMDKFIKGDKGDPGITPIKGLDYFTQLEINDMETNVISEVVERVSTTQKVWIKATLSEIDYMNEHDTWEEDVVYYTTEEDD